MSSTTPRRRPEITQACWQLLWNSRRNITNIIRNSESGMTTKFIWTLWGVTIWATFFLIRLGSRGQLLEYNNESWYFVTFLEFPDELSGDRFIEKNLLSIKLWIYLLWPDWRCAWLPRVQRQLQPSSSYSALKICAAGLSKHQQMS